MDWAWKVERMRVGANFESISADADPVFPDKHSDPGHSRRSGTNLGMNAAQTDTRVSYTFKYIRANERKAQVRRRWKTIQGVTL